LDLGTRCGYARFDSSSSAPYRTGAWDFKPTRFDSPALRYVKFGARLTEHLALGVDMVFYEKVVRHIGTAAAHAYGAFLFKLHETCDAFEVPYIGLSVQEIKVFAAGKGNAAKTLVMDACKTWGFDPKTEDESDAIAILRCGMETKL
jgi:hypothetical protein